MQPLLHTNRAAAESVAAQLIADEHQAVAKATAKKAKKQKQKGKRQQAPQSALVQQDEADSSYFQGFQDSSLPDANTTEPCFRDTEHAIKPDCTPLPTTPQQDQEAGSDISIDKTSQGICGSNADSDNEGEQRVSQAESGANADDDFLQTLFCCPITKVTLVLLFCSKLGFHSREQPQWPDLLCSSQAKSCSTKSSKPHGILHKSS